MSYRLTKAAIHSAAKGTAQHVLATMADAVYDKKVNDNDKKNLRATCNTSKSYLATTAGYSVNTISRALKELQTLGLIAYDPKRKVASSYDLIIPIPKVDQNGQRDGNRVDQNGEPSSKEVPQNDEPSESEVDQNGGEVDQNGQHNRVLNKEETRESTKQASNIESKTNTENQPKQTNPITQGVLPAARDDKLFTLKQVALDARAKLIADGMPNEEAEKRLLAVSKDFKAKALALKAKNYEGISNPKKYLVAKLVGMAKDFNPSTPAPAQEPTSLEEIFNLLKTEWSATYPEVAEYIARLELDHVNDKLVSKLRGKESASWKSVPGSRIGYVRSTLDGTIYERVQEWRQEEIRDLENHLKTVRWSLATYRSEPSAYYDPHKTVEERIKELEASEADTKAALKKLRAKAKK